MELAEAREHVAQTELEHAQAGSKASSLARLADVQSESGTSARARQRSSAELAVPLIQLDEVLNVLPEAQESPTYCLPVNMESESGHGHTFIFQHSDTNEGCHFGAQTANTWQEAHVAVNNVVRVAEERRQ